MGMRGFIRLFLWCMGSEVSFDLGLKMVFLLKRSCGSF